ncbi:MAG: orotate phosphoribosyltransferase [Chitinophagaceae bacterium]
MKNEAAVAEKLLQIQAIKLNADNPFTWASGWKSPIYCDNRKVLSFPAERDFIKNELCNLIQQDFPNVQLLAGVATAGIAWGALAADQLKLPFCYVRPKPKEHGLGNQVEGYYEEKQKVVVVEDLISTGKSSIQVVDVLRGLNVEVIGMISIFSYGFDEAVKSFAAKDVKILSLTNYAALLPLAVEKNIIKQEQVELLSSWKSDPSNWGK